MLDEPKKPIEDLLAAHADKRRTEAGSFELHEVTRQLLLGEVQRVQGRAPVVKPVRTAWFHLWTRLAGAFGFVGLLWIALLIVRLNTSDRTELAQLPTEMSVMPEADASDRLLGEAAALSTDTNWALVQSDAAPANDSAILLAAETPAPVDGLAFDEPAGPARLSLSIGDEPAPRAPQPSVLAPVTAPTVRQEAETPVGAVATADTANVSSGLLTENQPLRDSVAEAPVPSREVALETRAQPRAAVFAAAVIRPPTDQFTRVSQLRRNLQSPPLPEVLRAFRLVVDGAAVRLEDADGSVYSGQLSEEAGDAPATLNVTGTDGRSGMAVQFSGTLAPATTEAGRVIEGTVSLGTRQRWRLRAEETP